MTKPSNVSRSVGEVGAPATAIESARSRSIANPNEVEPNELSAGSRAHSSAAGEARAGAGAVRDGGDARTEPSGRARPAFEENERDGEVRWRRLLSGGTPREILCRIVQGDPLGLRDRVALRLHADAYLLDADRVLLRALARCARFAGRYQGRPELGSWLDEIAGQAVEEVLREDLEPDLARATVAPPSS